MPRAKYTKGSDGRFRTAIRTGEYDEQGRPVKIYLSSNVSSADLERKVQDIKYKMRHGIKTPIQTNRILFSEYADKFLRVKEQRSIKTYEMYENVLKHVEILYSTPMEMIRASDIQLLITANSNHPRTCEQILLTLRQIFDMAIDDDILTKNPCRNIELPRHVKHEKRAFTEEEKTRIKKAEGLTPLERAYVHVLYGTGVRPGEAQALTWKDVDFKNHTITINKALQFTNSRTASVGLPKTDKSIRTLPVPDFVIDSISALKQQGVHSPTFTLFGTDTGELRTRSAYKNIWDSAAKKLKLEGVSAYYCRHDFCTRCRMNNVDIKICQALMGHSDTKMINNIYTHLDTSQSALSVAMNKLDF